MKRRHPIGRVDEVAFADVAMAILGPILLIMTVALVIAARSAAHPAEKAKEAPPCRSLRGEDLDAYAGDLKRYGRALQREANQLTDMAKLQCGLSTSEAVEPPPLMVLPQTATDLCPADMDRLMAAIGVSSRAWLTQVARRDQALRVLKTCLAALPAARCNLVPDDRVEVVANELRAWHARSEQRARQLESLIGSQCPQPIPTAEVEPTFRPPPLAKLCPSDVERVVARSGIAPGVLLADEARWRARADLLSNCTSHTSETISQKFRQFEFKQCSTTPKDSDSNWDRDLPLADIEARFDEVAERLAVALADAPFNNRIYIYGHTDNQPVGERGCAENRARDNVRLSLERSDWFRLGLIAAFERAPIRYRDILERLEARTLHIYPVGVGAQEPLDHNAWESDAAYEKRNRRIEVLITHKPTIKDD